MAVAAVGDILAQPQGGARNEGRGESFTLVRKGDYGDLLAEAEALVVHAENTVGSETIYVASWNLERAPGGLGVLTIVGGDGDDGSSSATSGDVASEKWSLRNVQQQIPLSRFWVDGSWSVSAPDGHELALWRQEPRRDLYDAYQFLAPDGSIYTLSQGSQAVAAKYRRGIESVMRFYPVVTRTTTYKKGMSDAKVSALGIGAKLAHAETPTKTFGLAPGAWLCIQDEGDFAADGTFVRTTGWMGCKSLDDNLYGDTNRWEPMG